VDGHYSCYPWIATTVSSGIISDMRKVTDGTDLGSGSRNCNIRVGKTLM